MQFNYQDLLNLGFDRLEINDSIFENQHGYKCFYLTKEIKKGFEFIWDCEDRKCEFRRCKKGRILSKYIVSSIEEIKMIIKFFETVNATVINKTEKKINCYTEAC